MHWGFFPLLCALSLLSKNTRKIPRMLYFGGFGEGCFLNNAVLASVNYFEGNWQMDLRRYIWCVPCVHREIKGWTGLKVYFPVNPFLASCRFLTSNQTTNFQNSGLAGFFLAVSTQQVRRVGQVEYAYTMWALFSNLLLFTTCLILAHKKKNSSKPKCKSWCNLYP